MSRAAVAKDMVIGQARSLKMPGVVRLFEALARQAREEHWGAQIAEFARGEWIGRAENIIFGGPIGTGKAHLAIALGRGRAPSGSRRARTCTARPSRTHDRRSRNPRRSSSAFSCRQMVGNVWEWTASDFLPYPGFVADPYKEYSEPWFASPHKVLRSGCWATRGRLLRNTWRNFYPSSRRDVLSGVRTCRIVG